MPSTLASTCKHILFFPFRRRSHRGSLRSRRFTNRRVRFLGTHLAFEEHRCSATRRPNLRRTSRTLSTPPRAGRAIRSLVHRPRVCLDPPPRPSGTHSTSCSQTHVPQCPLCRAQHIHRSSFRTDAALRNTWLLCLLLPRAATELRFTADGPPTSRQRISHQVIAKGHPSTMSQRQL